MTFEKDGERIEVLAIDRHRNGVVGAPFHVVTFTAQGYTLTARHGALARFVATVFDAPNHISVLEIGMLNDGNILFGENSWRGDNFEGALRAAIAFHERDEEAKYHPMYRANALDAYHAAQRLADTNGAPVSVLTDGRWFRVEESAEEMERLIDEDGWQEHGLVDPEEVRA